MAKNMETKTENKNMKSLIIGLQKIKPLLITGDISMARLETGISERTIHRYLKGELSDFERGKKLLITLKRYCNKRDEEIKLFLK